MAEFVIFGHGGFVPGAGGYPGEVLVPTGTTLQFFAEAGEALRLPMTGPPEKRVLDVAKFQGPWTALKDEGSPLQAKAVTYNFLLQPERSEAELDAILQVDWGAKLISPGVGGESLYLCTDTEGKCPTPALLVQAKAYEDASTNEDGKKVDGDGTELEPIGDERWLHHCTGILGMYGGQDLKWVACASLVLDAATKAELPTLVGTQTGIGVDKEFSDQQLIEHIKTLNEDALNGAKEGTPISIAVGGGQVLVGTKHFAQAADQMRALHEQGLVEEGQIHLKSVDDGSGLKEQTYEVSGISDGGRRKVVSDTLDELSPGITVKFV